MSSRKKPYGNIDVRGGPFLEILVKRDFGSFGVVEPRERSSIVLAPEDGPSHTFESLQRLGRRQPFGVTVGAHAKLPAPTTPQSRAAGRVEADGAMA